MNHSNEVNYSLFTIADADEMCRLLGHAFADRDPPAVAVGLSAAEFEAFVRLFCEKAATEGLTMVARSALTGEMIGALLAEDSAAALPAGLGQVSDKFNPILDILGQLDAEYRGGRPAPSGQSVHLFLLGVAHGFAGRGVAQQLVATCLANGLRKGYRFAVTEATNTRSQHVFRKQGFSDRVRRTYQDHRFEGRAFFSAISGQIGPILMDRSLSQEDHGLHFGGRMSRQPDYLRQLEGIVPALTALVRHAVPEATIHFEEQSDGYFCWSCRLRDRATRELFVEQAGPDVPPFILRVGIYFADAVVATSQPALLERAFAALLTARPGLQALGAAATFTHGTATRDDVRYGWSDDELRAWLTSESANRDLVWLWDLQNGLPAQSEMERVIRELLPVWRAWNAIEPARGGKSASGTNSSIAEEASRNLDSIRPFFIVKNLQASISYYVGRLGFQLDFEGPEGDPYYAGLSRDGIGVMLKAILPDVLPCPNRTRHEWARWDAYIYSLDPDALFDEFRQRGVSFVTELSFIDKGLWGFEITDADGYVLAFFRLRDEENK